MPDMVLKNFSKLATNLYILIRFHFFPAQSLHTTTQTNLDVFFTSLFLHNMLIQPVLGMCNARHGCEKSQ